MVCPPFKSFSVDGSQMVEQSDDLRLSIIGIGPFQCSVGSLLVDEREISINAVSEVGSMGVPFRGGKNDVFQTKVARVDVQSTASLRVDILSFDPVGRLFDLWQGRRWNQGLERKEMTKKNGAHLLG